MEYYWSKGQFHACIYPNTGYSSANFFGTTVLTPFDQDLYHKTNYGSEYMFPDKKPVYHICHPIGRWIEFDGIRFLGPRTSYVGLCTASSTSCSPGAREPLIVSLLLLAQNISAATGLSFVLACASHEYALGSPEIPTYAAIAVKQKDMGAWLLEFRNARMTATIEITNASQTAHGSFVVSSSGVSPVKMIVLKATEKAMASVSHLPYGNDKIKMPVSGLESVKHLCSRCKDCQRLASTPLMTGKLININTETCLAVGSGRAILKPCLEVILYVCRFLTPLGSDLYLPHRLDTVFSGNARALSGLSDDGCWFEGSLLTSFC
jgi:hypothetical protein